MASRRNTILLLSALVIVISVVSAQYSEPGSSSSESPDAGGASNIPSAADGGAFDYTETASYRKFASILVAHAVLGTVALTFFAPVGGIFLRLNLPGVSLLKYHIITQLVVYGMILACTGLGVWLAIEATKFGGVYWTDNHVILGLIIVSLASIQPWLGQIHHVVFKRRLFRFKKGMDTKRPGRTFVTIAHLYIGRVLILLGVINGALGLRRTQGSPFQTLATTRKAEIVYGVLAGLIFLLFAGVAILFEHRRASRIRAWKTRQQMVEPMYGQPDLANRIQMPFSPITSEESLEFDEKGSEIGW